MTTYYKLKAKKIKLKHAGNKVIAINKSYDGYNVYGFDIVDYLPGYTPNNLEFYGYKTIKYLKTWDEAYDAIYGAPTGRPDFAATLKGIY